MPTRQKTLDLARRLVTSDAEADPYHLPTEQATVRVYEKLRRQLGALVGVHGFQVLASRALALTKLESPRFATVQVMANGTLTGLSENESESEAEENGETVINLIAQLIGLFLVFLGEATTLRLIEDLRGQVDVQTKSDSIPGGTLDLAADGPELAAAFVDLLLETGKLRSVGDRIEALANKHPGMEDGLVTVAGNIRSIATVLDVFTLLRSKAGGSQEDGPDPETNRYMN